MSKALLKLRMLPTLFPGSGFFRHVFFYNFLFYCITTKKQRYLQCNAYTVYVPKLTFVLLALLIWLQIFDIVAVVVPQTPLQASHFWDLSFMNSLLLGIHRGLHESSWNWKLLPLESDNDQDGAVASRRFPWSHQIWSVCVGDLLFKLFWCSVLCQSYSGFKRLKCGKLIIVIALGAHRFSQSLS